jgi:mannose-6-phosphate isomerase-like protein (cupin superfamily)
MAFASCAQRETVQVSGLPRERAITDEEGASMSAPRGRLLACVIALTGLVAVGIFGRAAPPERPGSAVSPKAQETLPDKDFTHAPEKPHDPAGLYFTFDQLDHYYRVPGEFTHRLTGDQYGFEALSFIISETHPGGGPGLHVHDTEEAHVLLEGSVQYRIGDKTFTVQAPYVAKVPAGVPHTFMNVGSRPFNLIAVFPTKHPTSKRVGPNPLIAARQNGEDARPGFIP